jgi:4-diphosphocytidyl-2-C-methyl-D-erythritol kinase
MSVTLRSFAKINLGLSIGAARADGFHELLTVYQTIGLHDVVRVRAERGSGIEIRCEDLRVPKDESNTCFRIVEKAMQALGAKGRVVIEIEKRLPVQGGLGGASANAVAALLGLERALKKSLPTAERLRIAGEVGSDLPLFLVGGTVLGMGRGEQVYPLEDLPPMGCAVIAPEVGVSTPEAFAAWDRLCGTGAPARGESNLQSRIEEPPGKWPAELRSPWTGKSARPHASLPHTGGEDSLAKLTLSDASDRMNLLGRGLSAWLSEPYSGAPLVLVKTKRGRAENPLLELVRAGIENDFEQVVFPEYPELLEGKRALELAGAKYASLSGSGSALYGLFASRATAAKAADRLQKQGWKVQATVTVTRRAYWRRIVAG